MRASIKIFPGIRISGNVTPRRRRRSRKMSPREIAKRQIAVQDEKQRILVQRKAVEAKRAARGARAATATAAKRASRAGIQSVVHTGAGVPPPPPGWRPEFERDTTPPEAWPAPIPGAPLPASTPYASIAGKSWGVMPGTGDGSARTAATIVQEPVGAARPHWKLARIGISIKDTIVYGAAGKPNANWEPAMARTSTSGHGWFRRHIWAIVITAVVFFAGLEIGSSGNGSGATSNSPAHTVAHLRTTTP